jgi:hypothetical protein
MAIHLRRWLSLHPWPSSSVRLRRRAAPLVKCASLPKRDDCKAVSYCTFDISFGCRGGATDAPSLAPTAVPASLVPTVLPTTAAPTAYVSLVWGVSAWMACSVTCGLGTQTRRIFCGLRDTGVRACRPALRALATAVLDGAV